MAGRCRRRRGQRDPRTGRTARGHRGTRPRPPHPLYPLQTTASVPARFFANRNHWPAGTYVVPEHSFAIDLTGVEAAISHEHTALEWRDYDAAQEVLRFDSNRTALGELHERLLASDLPHPVKSDRP